MNWHAVKLIVNIYVYTHRLLQLLALVKAGNGANGDSKYWEVSVWCLTLCRWDISQCHPIQGPGNIPEEEVKYCGSREWGSVRWSAVFWLHDSGSNQEQLRLWAWVMEKIRQGMRVRGGPVGKKGICKNWKGWEKWGASTITVHFLQV